MNIKTGIQIARLATTLGWIEEKDWKTPKVISKAHRKAITKKAMHNASKAGYTFVRSLI